MEEELSEIVGEQEKKRKKIERRKTIALIILGVIFLSTAIYLGQERYREQDEEENINFYRVGTQDTMAQIFKRALSCEPFPITFPVFNNQTNQSQDVTVNLIAMECLNANS